MVANGNNSNGRCYGVDEESCQGDAKAIGETTLMVTTIEREEISKVLIQINIGSEGYGIEQHYGCMCGCMWRGRKEKYKVYK